MEVRRRAVRVAVLLVACAARVAWAAAQPPPAVVLPLRRVNFAASHGGASHRRVLLGNATAAAVLPLFGSVRDNGVFTVHLALGTPPQTFDLIVDTGSTLAYVPCKECGASCGKHEARGRVPLAPRGRGAGSVPVRCPHQTRQCGRGGTLTRACGRQDPFFSPELSATYRSVPCSSPLCTASFAQRCQLGAHTAHGVARSV